MRERPRELITALLFIGIGSAYGGWAYFHYDLGTLRRVGPGMFPLGFGALLLLIGVFLALPALRAFRGDQRLLQPELAEGQEAVENDAGSVRAGVFVLLSLVAFALVLPNFGAAPALFALVYTAVLAEPGRDWRITPALIAGFLSIFVWLVFVQALSLPLTMLKWPF